MVIDAQPATTRIRAGLRRMLTGAAIALLSVVVVATTGCRSQSSTPASASGLHIVRDMPLPGDTSRFDYESLDAETGRLYIAHLGADSVVVFDTRAHRVIGTIADVPGVHGVLVVPQLGRLYATATDRNEVSVIDLNTLNIIASVPAGDYPDGLAFDPDNGKLYVSDEGGATDRVIDTATNQLVATIQIGGDAGNTQYDMNSKRIYVAVQTTNEVVAIDPNTDQVVDRFALPGCKGAHGLLVDGAQQAAFVGCEDNATLVILDLEGRRVIGKHDVGSTPDVLAADADGSLVYVAAEDGVVTTLAQENQELRRVASGYVGPNAHAVAVDPQTHDIYLPLKDVDGRPILREMAIGAQRDD